MKLLGSGRAVPGRRHRASTAGEFSISFVKSNGDAPEPTVISMEHLQISVCRHSNGATPHTSALLAAAGDCPLPPPVRTN